LSELDLPQFERIMAQDFSFFQEACGLDKDAFFSIGIPNENGNAPSAEMRRWEYSSNIQLAGLLGLFQVRVRYDEAKYLDHLFTEYLNGCSV
jgi:hypothetical protein